MLIEICIDYEMHNIIEAVKRRAARESQCYFVDLVGVCRVHMFESTLLQPLILCNVLWLF